MKNKILFLIILVIVGGVFWLSRKDSTQGKVVYKEVKPQYGSVADIISTTGLVEPQNRLEIIPPISGRIEKIYVKEGQYVKTGDTLAIMSSTDRAALLDAAQTEGAEKVKYWEEVYKPTSLLAPINGKVIVRAVEPGQTVNTNTAILVLANKLIITAQVDETDIGQIKIGQAVSISLDAYPDIKINGKVGHISYESKIVNNVTIYEVDIIPHKVLAIFRSGMSANVNITKSLKKNVLLIPQEAIQYKEGKNIVLIKDNSKLGFKEASLITGAKQDGFLEVISGVEENNILLIKQTSLNQNQPKKSSSFFSRPGSQRKR